MSLLLNVPETDKAIAQAAGALVDNSQHWYLPNAAYGRLKEVQQWILPPSAYLILSDILLIAQGSCVCPHCGHTNKVISLASDSFYEKDMNERDEEVWLEQDFFSIFHRITTISDNLKEFLTDNFSRYHLTQPTDNTPAYWYNHCEQCHQAIDDHRLMQSPGCPFHPRNEEEATAITLHAYPMKFAPLMDAGYERNYHQRLIAEFAKRI
ncbi:TraR/DksA family transcriptional regulator [Chitinophaga sp. Cy-1792]|uniref:TraR/DksA family transcriptional regulator n=1 Tax=Chitinophaga sp. Cy-1792 TaxID=2608339 RepID=UPI001420E579|nr:TraR/DksA family transcriptional regulator [Chitinophaga sp. Cy-1792]NIG56844.1 TraR/DksA family transcriptional regulator [Chitinophaga sp. Cy-1792]